MKKVIALFIALMFLIVCSACSNQEDSTKSDDSGDAKQADSSKPADSGTAEPTVTAMASKSASVAIGDIITFGIYPQTAEGTDRTPIEWIVLDVQDEKALLLSKYGLDAKPYNDPGFRSITWEKCSLRTWLNSDFLKKAFSADEQSAILTTKVDNSAYQGYSKWDTDGGNNTEDRIFLLSYREANRYLGAKYWEEDDGNNVKSRVAPTDYAIKNGAYIREWGTQHQTSDGKRAVYWWLRSPGKAPYYAIRVSDAGSLFDNDVRSDDGVVRPAFWLNLESGIF